MQNLDRIKKNYAQAGFQNTLFLSVRMCKEAVFDSLH